MSLEVKMASKSTIILITGANSGVGYATAKVAVSASSAYHVILACRSLEKAQAALAEIQATGVQGSLSTLQLDVTDEQSVNAATKQVEEQFGRVDVLINNAGISSLESNIPKNFDATLRTNVIGVALVTAAFESLLLKSSRPYLLNVGSGLGSCASTMGPNSPFNGVLFVSYSVSKAALNMLTVKYTKILGEKGVKVFVVCPGLVRSYLRGHSEEEVSSGGRAGDPAVSGQLILDVIEGKRDADVGRLIHKDGVYPW